MFNNAFYFQRHKEVIIKGVPRISHWGKTEGPKA